MWIKGYIEGDSVRFPSGQLVSAFGYGWSESNEMTYFVTADLQIKKDAYGREVGAFSKHDGDMIFEYNSETQTLGNPDCDISLSADPTKVNRNKVYANINMSRVGSGAIGTITPDSTTSVQNNRTFDLTGRVVKSDNLPAGIYIRGGKKIVIH